MTKAKKQPSASKPRRSPHKNKRGRSLIPPLNKYTIRAVLVGGVTGAVTFVLLSALILFGLYGYFQFSGRILPGVRVGDLSLGGMTPAGATGVLSAAWNSGQTLVVTDGQHSWSAAPTDFGLLLDAAATAQRAHEVGHGQGFFTEFFRLIESATQGTQVEPVVTLNVEAARAGLENLAGTVNVPPQDASLEIQGGTVVAIPGTPGHTLDVEATLTLLTADPGAALENGVLPLVLVPVAPRIGDASAAVAQAEQLLNGSLAVLIYDPVTDERIDQSIQPDQIAGWLGFEAGDSGLHVIVQGDRLEAYLAALSDTLGPGRYLDAAESAPALTEALSQDRHATLIVRHAPSTYAVQSGDTLTRIAWQVGMPYWKLLEANPGIEANAIVPGQVLNVPSKDDLLPLPVVVNKRIQISIGEQHMWIYENGQQINDFVISTGIDRSPTQPGIFQVQTHELNAYASVWDLWMPHFIGIYESWPGFMNGIHGLPTLSSGYRLWADILGRPASYGCIILDLDDAELLYNWADQGVVVEIVE